MAIWSLHLTKPQTGAQLGSMKEMDILPSGHVTGQGEGISKEQVAEDGKEAQDKSGHVTGQGEGISKEQVAEDGKEAQDKSGLEDEEETNILTSINCLPEPPLNERMGAIAFSSKDEEKDQWSKNRQNMNQRSKDQKNKKQWSTVQQNKNKRSKDQQSKILQMHAPVTLRCGFSLAEMLVIALAIYLPPLAAGADLEVREKDLGHKGLSANESLQVTDNITRSDLLDGSYFGVFTSRGYEEFICTWEFVEKNQECRLELGINEQCDGLSIVKDALQEHVHIALDGASVEDRKSICIAQHVPNQFVVYQVETFRKPAPTCPALPTAAFVSQSGCDQDPPGHVKPGSVCHFSCPDGYIGHGYENKTCMADGTWSSTNFTCEAPTCPALPTAAFVSQSGCDQDPSGHLEPGSVCHFSCPDGYIRHGYENKTCMADGTWSSTNFTCEAASHFDWESAFNIAVPILVYCLLVSVIINIITCICLKREKDTKLGQPFNNVSFHQARTQDGNITTTTQIEEEEEGEKGR